MCLIFLECRFNNYIISNKLDFISCAERTVFINLVTYVLQKCIHITSYDSVYTFLSCCYCVLIKFLYVYKYALHCKIFMIGYLEVLKTGSGKKVLLYVYVNELRANTVVLTSKSYTIISCPFPL